MSDKHLRTFHLGTYSALEGAS